MLHIYNTLTKKKERFQPLLPGKIGLYVCGMTVYDYCHIGHARVLVIFDAVTRYLRSQGYEVTYVRNITDIDDKIIKRAQENKEEFSALTKRFIAAMLEDTQALGVLPPSKEPRATACIAEMIALIQTLLEKNYAYIAENGDVYYSVHHFKHYGRLGHQDLEKLRAGARIAVADVKQDPLDFVLWKLAKPDEPSWDSPWGKGRPGWHIECSAMSMRCLGQHFDIHGGGFDLIFPHHENEIAQSEAASGERFVNTWMHVGFLQIEKEKMSKSLGNFLTIREVLAQWPAEVVRYFLLSGQYRGPLHYSTEAFESAQAALTRFYTALRGLPADRGAEESELLEVYEQRFQAAMNDDFNTPDALAVLFDLVRDMNRLRTENPAEANTLAGLLRRLGNILGLLGDNPDSFLQKQQPSEWIEQAIKARNQARQNKDWAEADRVRDQLLEKGIVLEDGPEGTTWRQNS